MDSKTIGLIQGVSTQIVTQEIAKVNQTIVSITSGIKSIVNTGSDLIFTLSDDSTLSVAITGLSSNDYTTNEKDKLAQLNSSILNLFTYVDNQLLFDGNPIVGESVDLSNYFNKTEINTLLLNKADKSYVDTQDDTKADLIHNHTVSDITNLQSELDNKVNIDGTKVLSTNDFTDVYQQKVDAMSNGSRYIGLFPTLTERNAVTGLMTGYWCTVDIDSSHSDEKTKYFYDGTTWVFDGIYQDNSFGIDDNSIDNTQNGWSANKLVNELNLKADKDDVADLTSVQGDILPTTNGLQNIGSPTNRFGTIYVNEAKLSTNTLYIGDTPVLGTTDDTIMVKADLNQSLAVKTTGVGTTKIISESGVELSTSGMNANVNVQATGSGANANLSATNQVNMTAPNINLSGSTDIKGGAIIDNLTVSGNIVMNGSAFTVEATTVRVADNIIELNKNEVGYGVTAVKSGIKVNRGDADDYLLVFDETDDMFKIGTDLTLQTIATQDYVNTHTHTHTNKAVIDKFTEVGGQPYYNGSAIVSGGSVDISTLPTF